MEKGPAGAELLVDGNLVSRYHTPALADELEHSQVKFSVQLAERSWTSATQKVVSEEVDKTNLLIGRN